MTIEEAAAAIAFAMADHTGEEALDVLLHAARMSVKYREALAKISMHIQLSAGPSLSKYSTLGHIANEALKDGD